MSLWLYMLFILYEHEETWSLLTDDAVRFSLSSMYFDPKLSAVYFIK